MAVVERKREFAEHEGGLGVVISRDEYREYTELKAKRDRSEGSLRAQMRLQNQAALNLSRKVVQLLDANKGLNSLLADTVYELANEILATE